jgi:hypothetical protein
MIGNTLLLAAALLTGPQDPSVGGATETAGEYPWGDIRLAPDRKDARTLRVVGGGELPLSGWEPLRRARGRVLVLDEGEERPARSGWMDLSLEDGTLLRFPLDDEGRWDGWLPHEPEPLAVCQLQVEGRDAFAERPGWPSPALRWNTFEVHARWSPQTWVRAVDPATGAVPRDIEVSVQMGFQPDGPPEGRGDLRPNPFRVPGWHKGDFLLGWKAKRTWWVRAPGYAWKRADLNLSVGGEQTIQLDAHPYDDQSIHGRVVVLDGVKRIVPRSGWIHFELESMMGDRTVRVVDGEWTLNYAEISGIMGIGDMELDGRHAHCPTDRLVTLDDTPNGIVARWTPAVSVTATDARSGETIEKLQVYCEDAFNRGRRPHGSRNPSLRPTPVPLSAWDRDDIAGWPFVHQRVWWVRAPGYAWKRVPVDHAVGGTREIQLEPESSLRVNLRGAAARVDWIRMLPAGARQDEGWKVSSWGTKFSLVEALEPGMYTVEAWGTETPEGIWHEQKLATGQVEVQAGERAVVELVIAGADGE